MARRRRSRLRLSIALILLGIGVLGCDAQIFGRSIPDTQRTPEIVGIVENLDAQSRLPLINLVGGGTYDANGATLIVQRGTLASGSLLLAGTHPTPWYAHLEEWVPGCFALVSGGRDDGTTVVTTDGLRLIKAPGFTAPHDPDGVYDRPNDQFCLGSDGRVNGYGLIH
jgi:hypothetical protein